MIVIKDITVSTTIRIPEPQMDKVMIALNKSIKDKEKCKAAHYRMRTTKMIYVVVDIDDNGDFVNIRIKDKS